MLVREKLNIVGETHTESKPRIDAEKQFCLKKTGSTNYWTEAEFPDLALARHQRGQQQVKGDPAADLMEFRATHGAAMLIDKLDKLGDEAVNVSAIPVKSAVEPVGAFNKKVREFIQVRDRIDRSWRPSSETVNNAVQAVHDNVESACQTYEDAFAKAPNIEQQQKAIRDFANSRVALRKLVPALATAVGASVSDAAELAAYMRRQRSTFMGLAAGYSKQVGVWKVGNLHIADLKDGTSKVDMSRFNIVTKEDFNQEFEVWQSGKTT